MKLLPPGEEVVFSHNDTQENNFLSNEQETKIIDFEYSCLNYRGADLASYINESAIDYSVKTEPPFKINFDKFAKFNEPWIQKCLELYLESDDTEEIQTFKEELKKLVLQQHIFWISWCLIMMKPSLYDPDFNPEKGIAEISKFYVPYAQARMECYFFQRK